MQFLMPAACLPPGICRASEIECSQERSERVASLISLIMAAYTNTPTSTAKQAKMYTNVTPGK